MQLRAPKLPVFILLKLRRGTKEMNSTHKMATACSN